MQTVHRTPADKLEALYRRTVRQLRQARTDGRRQDAARLEQAAAKLRRVARGGA